MDFFLFGNNSEKGRFDLNYLLLDFLGAIINFVKSFYKTNFYEKEYEDEQKTRNRRNK